MFVGKRFHLIAPSRLFSESHELVRRIGAIRGKGERFGAVLRDRTSRRKPSTPSAYNNQFFCTSSWDGDVGSGVFGVISRFVATAFRETTTRSPRHRYRVLVSTLLPLPVVGIWCVFVHLVIMSRIVQMCLPERREERCICGMWLRIVSSRRALGRLGMFRAI